MYVEEVINRYIEVEENALRMISEMEGSDKMGTPEWKVRKEYEGRLKLLQDLKRDLID